ncbi:eukaryotic translation initiation factor 3 subunit M isoform X1 [Medicago truncatula]|uniref:eukaryotic translation initiation factor 3 subunit M isoform X1 n=1 Tax=Medicago truncatula TaxID=3880 RepID=UPI0019680C6B|nr:eukaryotic translation initiation factor 3 subunit M isoform X1 [Medicago truncatula]
MTTVVPTSEEDAALSVVRFASELAWADAGPEVAEPQVTRLCLEAEEFIAMGKWLELASLMITSAELIFSKVSEKDVESIFTIVCNLVTKTENPDEVMEIVKVITAKLVQQPNEKPAVRLKILINLYNLLETPYCQFYVYMKALNLAVDGKVTEYIIPSFKKIDSFLKEWKIGTPEQRELFLTISNVLKENKSLSKDSFKFLTNYLATFSGEEAHVLSEAKEEAVRAIVDFVKAPDVFQCDLLDMPAVGQLENDAKYALLYQLLKIFLTQRLDAYLEYHTANSTLLNDYGLVHEECIAKMRLMSLVDLSADGSGQIPYELIRDTLQINDDEVELWVFKAITAKLIDCKMDQMNQVVLVRYVASQFLAFSLAIGHVDMHLMAVAISFFVNSILVLKYYTQFNASVDMCSHHTDRVFGQHQWQTLRTKLVTWRGNISNVISTIQANKVSEDGSQAAQGLAVR